MNKEKISQALTTGLINGYGGKTEFAKINRAGFEMDSSHFQNEEIIYHDEWTNNGGQELIKVDNELFTRVYAGGAVDENIRQSLDIKEHQISNNLRTSIIEFGDKTRLFSNFKGKTVDNWDYEYQIIDHNSEINVTTGKETMSINGHTIFIHVFVLSPIK